MRTCISRLLPRWVAFTFVPFALARFVLPATPAQVYHRAFVILTIITPPHYYRCCCNNPGLGPLCWILTTLNSSLLPPPPPHHSHSDSVTVRCGSRFAPFCGTFYGMHTHSHLHLPRLPFPGPLFRIHYLPHTRCVCSLLPDDTVAGPALPRLPHLTHPALTAGFGLRSKPVTRATVLRAYVCFTVRVTHTHSQPPPPQLTALRPTDFTLSFTVWDTRLFTF